MTKLSKALSASFYKATSSTIIHIPKALKKPKENYVEPAEWNLLFEKPSQVKPKAFIDYPCPLTIEHLCKSKSNYKTHEYFSYHPYSYYNMEMDLFCKRCRPQPSPFCKVDEYSDEKAP